MTTDTTAGITFLIVRSSGDSAIISGYHISHLASGKSRGCVVHHKQLFDLTHTERNPVDMQFALFVCAGVTFARLFCIAFREIVKKTARFLLMAIYKIAVVAPFWCWYYLMWGADEIWEHERVVWEFWWWYDTVGHCVFGAALALTFIWFGMRSVPWTVFWVMVIAFFWEYFEVAWDASIRATYFPWLGHAHAGSVDTIIDLSTAFVFSFIAAALCRCIMIVLLPGTAVVLSANEGIALMRQGIVAVEGVDEWNRAVARRKMRGAIRALKTAKRTARKRRRP